MSTEEEWQPQPGEMSIEERARRTDLWEHGADERERLADERDALADERDVLADEREQLADRREGDLDRRETGRFTQARSLGDLDQIAEENAAHAAVRRAEAAMRRARAQLVRAREAGVRVVARAARRRAREEQLGRVDHADALDTEERAWRADRRDFVAADRGRVADARDDLADAREQTARLREQMADGRDRESLEREHRLDRSTIGRPGAGPRRRVPVESDPDASARQQRQREQAASGRRAAAQDRAAAAAAWGPQPYGPKLLASFADVARQLIAVDDLSGVLRRVLMFTVGAVPRCDGASVTLWRETHVAETVATSAAAAELDDVAFGGGFERSLDFLGDEDNLYLPCLGDLSHRPVLAAAATRLGIGSALCTGLFTYQVARWEPLGVFSIYSADPDAFTDEDREFTGILAAYIAVAVALANRREDVDRREAALHRGLSSRDVIGQAKGILMERQHFSAGDAFDVLRRASQRLNVRLADVASHLAETGELPSEPPAS